MKRWTKIFTVVLFALAMSTSAFSLAAAAPREQATATGYSNGSGYAFQIFVHRVMVAKWTTTETFDGSKGTGTWATTDLNGAVISSGTLTTTEVSKASLTHLTAFVTQDYPVAGTARLDLVFLGQPDKSVVGGVMSYSLDGTNKEFVVVGGAVLGKAAMLQVGHVAPVMFMGVQPD